MTGWEWQRFAERVKMGSLRMGYSMSPRQVEQFVRHGKELMEWNAAMNLTAISDLEVLAEKQFLDVIPLAQILPMGWCVLDVGSGGGFPGVPLQILRPDLNIGLMDAVRKKTSFLKHLVRELGLKGVWVKHARLESLGEDDDEGAAHWDVVTAKAVGEPEVVFERCVPFVGRHGWVVMWIGKDFEGKEMWGARAAQQGCLLRVHPYVLPFTGTERRLVVLEKDGREAKQKG